MQVADVVIVQADFKKTDATNFTEQAVDWLKAGCLPSPTLQRRRLVKTPDFKGENQDVWTLAVCVAEIKIYLRA